MMPHSDICGRRKRLLISSRYIGLGLFCLLWLSSSPAESNPLLKKCIIEYNLAAIEKSLADDSYRGEEGILRIGPQTANELGIKAFINEDYQDAMRLLKEADNALVKARRLMQSREREKYPGYFAENIADNFIIFKAYSQEAKQKLLNYHSMLSPDNDERFDNGICETIIDRLLEEGLNKAYKRLRDGLGHFYNACQGLKEKEFPLTVDNIPFVNYVFNAFLEQASAQDMGLFDLERAGRSIIVPQDYDWKSALGSEVSELIDMVEAAAKKCGKDMYDVDPLLFVALIKQESDFDTLAISYVGAAGLTQIMPATAKDMGMSNIHMPEYYNNALALIKQEKESRNRAMAALFKITEDDKLKYAEEARSLMQTSLDLGQERETLIKKYKKELLTERTDERLDPAKAIEYGLIYFARLMEAQKGDISLALASYNAGRQRVEEYKGIPPFSETIGFRNGVLQCYYDYLERVGTSEAVEGSKDEVTGNR
jgi:hypothetical protein